MIEHVVMNKYGDCIICGKIGLRKYCGLSVKTAKRRYKEECKAISKYRF